MSEPNTAEHQAVIRERSEAWQVASDHSWRYFELHAGQRIAVFNFFTVLSGLLAAGIVASIQGGPQFAGIGLVLGGLLTLLAFLFWKLDQRVSFLIKRAEKVQALAEELILPVEARLFSSEASATADDRMNNSKLTRQWTYGASFRLVFMITAGVGMISFATSGARIIGSLTC